MTSYVVLGAVASENTVKGDLAGTTYKYVATVDAHSAEHAIRVAVLAAIDTPTGNRVPAYVAVSARQFKPLSVTVERTEPKIILSR